jgi:23S rRNA (uracil747-C5)-methyltransferase
MAVGGAVGDLLLGLQNRDGSVHDLMHCPLYPSALQKTLKHIRDWLNAIAIAPYDIHARTGELKFVLLSCNTNQKLMLRLVLRSQTSLRSIKNNLSSLQKLLPDLDVISINLQPEPKAILEGAEEIILSSSANLPIMINDVPLQLSPQSFFQTNSAIAAKLYQRASSWLLKIQPKSVLDLYCGVGGFALHAAKALPNTKALGIELSAAAIECAKSSAAQMRLSNAHFVCADATQSGTPIDDDIDTIIVNPPRRGLGTALCDAIERSRAQFLVYSSCNLDSLVNDLKHLPSFQAQSGQVLDMFAHTPHFEVIVSLQRI